MKNNNMPREKLLSLGVKALDDYELLAIMLGSGTKNEDVIALSKRLCNDYGLPLLLKMSYEELNKIKGIKEAKATKLMASFEIARRASVREIKKQFKASNDIYDFLYDKFLYLDNEKMIVIYTDNKCRMIDYEEIGGISYRVEMPVRHIVSRALQLNSYGIILSHNHPSGEIKPSKDDIIATKLLARTLSDINVLLLDHLIIGKEEYYSFNDDNRL